MRELTARPPPEASLGRCPGQRRLCSAAKLRWPASPPNLPVQRAELDGFGDVVGGEAFGGGQVGDGAGDLEDAIVGAGAEVLLRHGQLEEVEGRGVERAMG